MANTAQALAQTTRRAPRWLAWIDRLSLVLALVGGVACVAMMVNIVADVLGRLFTRPLPGTVDITQFAWMPTLVSLGLGYALLAGQHIRINLVTGPSREGMQRIIEVVAMGITLVTASAFAWYGAERAMRSMMLAEFSSSTPWLPVWVFRWVIVVGLLGLVLQALAQLVRAVTVPVFDPDDEGTGIDIVGGDPEYPPLPAAEAVRR